MSDLISRSALIRTIKCRKDVHKVEYAHDKRESDFIRCCECSEIERLVNDAPTVEVKPVVHGEWIENTVGCYVCSNCRQLAKGDMTGCFKDRKFRQERTDFCPNCGADMRGGKNE